MHDILITADNLSYKINENRLFSSVSFSLKKGECLHIKGSNGSGKSTLLRIILGITSPTKGEIKANIKKNIAYGQQKKLALLRIFLGNTNLIVLDEPFVGLDIENQNILSNFLNKQLQKERGIIFTSHINCNVDSKTIKID